jgi:heparanase 1
MKPLRIIILLSACFGLIFNNCHAGDKKHPKKETNAVIINVNPKTVKYLGTVDERYQSYNIEMAEVIGGNFWKPYPKDDLNKNKTTTAHTDVNSGKGDADTSLFQAIPPIDLSDIRLRKLAAALGPAYLRVSGGWANSVFFQDKEKAIPKGFNGVFTKAQWKGVIDFSKAVDAKLVTSFAICAGVRDSKGVWTSKEAKKIVDYTKSSDGVIAAAELFNEPTIPEAGGGPAGYTAQTFAKDIAVFRAFAKKSVPGMLILGPGSSGEVVGIIPKTMPFIHTVDLLSAFPKPEFDVFSYHFYGAVSQRCASMGKEMTTTPEAALTQNWLSLTDSVLNFYKKLQDQFAPGKPIWLTETADAACGGNPWAVTFLDCFRYLEQLGRLAKGGVQVIFHNTLAASEYGLLDQKTHLPRPHYWAALLWAKFMDKEVYDPGKGTPGVDLFAHSMKGHEGGITLLVINTNKTKTTINISGQAQQYTLTSKELQGKIVQLNGVDLQLDANDELPAIIGISIKAGNISLPPLSITFITFPNATM